ncbi:MAG: roadblock/LC7 domain-containing protein [Polyangiaceae bacterium]
MKDRRRRQPPPRDQVESPFHHLLAEFLRSVPFARGAAIVDFEGETVDYAGTLDPFELRVAAATFQLLLADLRGSRHFNNVEQVASRMGRAGYLVRVLDPSYSLLVVLRKLGTFEVSTRILVELESRILHEAGLPTRRPPAWYHVEVEVPEHARKPTRLRPPQWSQQTDPWVSLEVLGTLVGSKEGERVYRVRLASGAECNLLREATRLWFVDEPIEAILRDNAKAEIFRPRRA